MTRVLTAIGLIVVLIATSSTATSILAKCVAIAALIALGVLVWAVNRLIDRILRATL